MFDLQNIEGEKEANKQDGHETTKSKGFVVDARTILQLGRQSIKDNATAVLELVKNSYDADADVVEVEICLQQENSYIRISDNGCGMTEDVIDNAWLRIGFSNKREDKISKRNRRKTGEKGVGRISADKLGSKIEVRTKAADHEAIGLVIDWNLFDVEGRDLSEVPVKVLNDVSIELPKYFNNASNTGTELTIRGLRDEWTPNDIQLLYEELSVLTPPFQQVHDFDIYLKTGIETDYKGLVKSSFQEAALIEFDGQFDGHTLRYHLVDRSDSSAPLVQDAEMEWKQLVHRISPGKMMREHALTGQVGLRLLFYLREKTDLLSEAGIQLSDLREFLDRNVGIKIYRDNIRVRPYGDPDTSDGDWLGLNKRKVQNPAGLDRRDYHFNSNQVVGAVFLSRDNNPALVDSASREGLIHGAAFGDMRALTLACLSLMEIQRHEAYQKRRQGQEQLSPGKVLSNFKNDLSILESALAQVPGNLLIASDINSAEAKQLQDKISRVAGALPAAEESLNKAMSEAGILRGLATLGIAASVFGHETQSALAQFVSSTALVRSLLQAEPPDVVTTTDEIEKAWRYARQVSAWGTFSLARVKRNKREKRSTNVKETICELVKGLQPAFQSASIRFDTTQLEDVSANLFEMDIEAIVLNLLTNAYVACQQVRRARVVRVELSRLASNGKDGFKIIVSDTGTGVPDDLANKIWSPLVTFKRDELGNEQGTGLGLTIVSSIVSEAGGQKSVAHSLDLGGARFDVWLPIE